MEEKFKYSLDNKRYHTYNYHVKTRFKQKVFKVTLNTNLSCPNRDGSRGYGGCIFCKDGSGEKFEIDQTNLMQQFEIVKNRLHQKWPDAKYVAYFQANTNTHTNLTQLESFFWPFAYIDNVVQIAIGTRPDCLSDQVIELLSKINKIKPVIIEIGLQTIHESTSELINRCFSYQEFEQAIFKLKRSNIEVCVHIINGLPNESDEMMVETVKEIAKLPIDGVKIHSLFILKDTVIAEMLENQDFDVIERQQYIDIVVKQLRHLPSNVVIHRLTGDGHLEDLIAPKWAIKKVTVLNDIDKCMKNQNVFQGDLYEIDNTK